MRISTRPFISILLLLPLLTCNTPADPLCLSSQATQGEQRHTKQTDAREAVKRALLVGISVYQPQDADKKPKDQGVVKSETATRQPASVARGGGRAAFSNLDGPKKDVAAMREVLAKKYGFTVIETLEDQKATRAAILDALKKNLINDAAPGDVCVFYYSGHGSRVKNSKGGEPDGYDESMVPADSNQGALDIRDKELARLSSNR